jgi:membrane associated rhomboid family serine protease
MTWAILLGSALLLVWVVTGGFDFPIIGLSLALVGVLGAVWFLTQPLWRQGRGIHRRRLQYVHVPFKSPRSPQDVG